MASRLQGITIEIGGNTTKLQEALKDVNKEVFSLNSDLKNLNTALKLDPKNTELLAQKQGVLKKNIEATTSRLDTLKEAQRQMNEQGLKTDEQKSAYAALSAEIAKSESALKKLENEYKNFGSVASQEIQRVGEKMKENGEKISDAGKKIMPLSAGALAVGTASIKMVGDLEQSLGGAEAVYKDYYDEIVNAAENSASKMGTSTNKYLEYANKIGSLMQGSGLQVSEAYDLTTKAMQRASDVASIMGISIDDAMNAITGAAKGNFTMMDNLGVAMNATTLQAYALSLGIDKTYSSMTNAEKVQLAYNMFLDQTAQYAGNYEKENETLNGSITTMTANLQNLAAEIGEKILPIATKILEFIAKIIDKFSNMSDGMQNVILVVGGVIAVAGPLLIMIGNVITALGTITIWIGKVQAFITGIMPVISSVAAAINWPVVAIAAVVTAIVVLYNKCEWFRNFVNSIIPTIVNLFKALPSMIANGISAASSAVSNAVKKIADFVKNGLKDLPKNAVNWGKDMINGFVDGIKKMASKVTDAVKGLAKKIKEFLHFSRPDTGPLREYEQWMPDFVKGLANGINRNAYLVERATSNLASKMTIDNLVGNVDSALMGLNAGINNSINPQINPNITYEQNYNMMAKAMTEALNGMEVELDDRQVGSFVKKTVTDEIYMGGNL